MYNLQLSPDSEKSCASLAANLNLVGQLRRLGTNLVRCGAKVLVAGMLLSLVYFFACVGPLHANGESEPHISSSEILIGLRDSDPASRQLRAANVSNEFARLNISGEVVSAVPHDMRGTASVSCDNTSVFGLRLTVATNNLDSTLEKLTQHPEVLFAVPNIPVYAADRFFDQTDLPQLAHGQQSGPASESSRSAPLFEIEDPLYPEQRWYMEQINATNALGQIIAATEAGASAVDSVVVAIIDSGIDAEHPEFTGRLQQGYNFLRPTELPFDDYGHGTHVAGLVGAAVNNGLGIAGMAPNVTVLSYKTLDQNGGGTIDNVVKAICRAVDDGADIINLSLTSPSQNTSQYTAAFDYARDRGVMMIAAAGNSRQTSNMWPARLDDVMAIAATNAEGDLASYSSPGDSIDMAAPGGEFEVPLLSTWSRSVSCNGTNPTPDAAGGTYCDSIGTSMSAALVSGVAAVLKSFHPDATAEEIRKMLKDTAQPTTLSDGSVGAGILDAEKAVTGAMGSRLVVNPVFDSHAVYRSSPPYTIGIEVDNPSFETLEWSVVEPNENWLSLSSPNGQVNFSNAATFDIVVKPQYLEPGNYGKALTLIGERPDGTLLFQNIQLILSVDSEYDPQGQLIVSGEPENHQWFSENTDSTFSTIIKFTNVGQEDLNWNAALDTDTSSNDSWVQLDSPNSGDLAFLDSVQLQLQVLPMNAEIGENKATITLSAERSDGSFAYASTELTIYVVPNTLLPLFVNN